MYFKASILSFFKKCRISHKKLRWVFPESISFPAPFLLRFQNWLKYIREDSQMKIDKRHERILTAMIFHFLWMALFKKNSRFTRKIPLAILQKAFLWFHVLFRPSSYDDVFSIVQDILFNLNFTFSAFLITSWAFWVDNLSHR
jgi:hypothetical protein